MHIAQVHKYLKWFGSILYHLNFQEEEEYQEIDDDDLDDMANDGDINGEVEGDAADYADTMVVNALVYYTENDYETITIEKITSQFYFSNRDITCFLSQN